MLMEIDRLEAIFATTGFDDFERAQVKDRLLRLLSKLGDSSPSGEASFSAEHISSATDHELFELIDKEIEELEKKK